MPTFKGEEALHYDSRIARLIPGYELLHQLTQAQLHTLFPSAARFLVVGAGTGFELVLLAKLNPNWHFVAQDISSDMLAIARQRCFDAGVLSQVTFTCEPLGKGARDFDAVLCLLVLHFLPDNGDKTVLLHAIHSHLKPSHNLFLADLMVAQTPFEREAQLYACRQLGLTDQGVAKTRVNLEREFYPLDKMRLAELLEQCGFDSAKPYFQALGFAALTTRALP
jgi:tRNA (cmo5U34)-methyltransferase